MRFAMFLLVTFLLGVNSQLHSPGSTVLSVFPVTCDGSPCQGGAGSRRLAGPYVPDAPPAPGPWDSVSYVIVVDNANGITDDIFDVYMIGNTAAPSPTWTYVGTTVEDYSPATGNGCGGVCRGGVFVPPSFGDTTCLPAPLYSWTGLSQTACNNVALLMEFCTAGPSLLQTAQPAPCVRIVTNTGSGCGNWLAMFILQVINGTTNVAQPLAYTEVSSGSNVDTTLCWGGGSPPAYVLLPTPSGQVTHSSAPSASTTPSAPATPSTSATRTAVAPGCVFVSENSAVSSPAVFSGLSATCSSTSYYNNCAAAPVVFMWTDTTPAGNSFHSASFSFSPGVECASSFRTVTLNGIVVGNFTPPAWCSCNQPSLNIVTISLSPVYVPGGTNTLSISTGAGCTGLAAFPQLNNGFGILAVDTYLVQCTPSSSITPSSSATPSASASFSSSVSSTGTSTSTPPVTSTSSVSTTSSATATSSASATGSASVTSSSTATSSASATSTAAATSSAAATATATGTASTTNTMTPASSQTTTASKTGSGTGTATPPATTSPAVTKTPITTTTPSATVARVSTSHTAACTVSRQASSSPTGTHRAPSQTATDSPCKKRWGWGDVGYDASKPCGGCRG